MRFKKAFFSKNALLEIRGSEEEGVFLSVFQLREDRTLDWNSRIAVAPTAAELMAMTEAVKRYYQEGAEGFRRYVSWLTGRDASEVKGISFVHTGGAGRSRFGFRIVDPRQEGDVEKLGFTIRREDPQQGERSMFFPLDRLSLLSLLMVLENKAVPVALEAETRDERSAPKRGVEETQEESQSRYQDEEDEVDVAYGNEL